MGFDAAGALAVGDVEGSPAAGVIMIPDFRFQSVAIRGIQGPQTLGDHAACRIGSMGCSDIHWTLN